VTAFARVIRGHPTIKNFFTGCNFHEDTLLILLSAMATLPSLEVADLALLASEGAHFETFEHPEALKKLMLSPSLRNIRFDFF
jgi:hypothetical protein